MSIATLSSKGQLIIPAEVRRKFNLMPQDKIEIRVEEEGIFLYPIPHDPVEACYGVLKTKKTARSMMVGARKEEKEIERRKAR